MAAEDAVAAGVRNRLVLALDVDDVVAAARLARQLRPWFATVKIGLELFCAAGPPVVQAMIDDGWAVFLDLKLADIPTTVERTSRVLGALGVRYLTLHAFAGPAVLAAGVTGLSDGAAQAGLEGPTALAVTVLTSDAGAPAHILGDRVAAAVGAGCGGVVCAASDVVEARRRAPGLLTVVPGIRPAGVDAHDQSRAATPGAAVAAGADLLVVGRAVTAAADRPAAAAALAAEVGAATAADP